MVVLRRSRRARGALLVALALVSAACNEKKTAPAGAGASSTSSASAAGSAGPRSAGVPALPGCHAASANVTKLSPASLSLAVAKGKALLLSTSYDGPPGGSTTSVGRAHAERVVVGTTGVPEGAPEPVNDALPAGDGVSTFAAATALGGALTTVAYGLKRPAPDDCSDAALVAANPGGPRRELLAHVCRPASTFRAAARGGAGVAFADGAPDGRTEAWSLDGTSARPVPLERLDAAPKDAGRPAEEGATSRVSLDAPSVAVGNASIAAAYVVVRGTTRELHVARAASRAGAEPTTAKVEVLDKQNVASVTSAFEDDTLHVVWSVFVPEKNRFVLRWSKWPAAGAPTAPQAIGTGVLSALTPSLAIDHGRFLLAWAEGDEKASTVVKVGASKNGLAFVSGLANVVSSPGVNGRDPVVALEADTMFVAWKELGPQAEVRVSPVKCRE